MKLGLINAAVCLALVAAPSFAGGKKPQAKMSANKVATVSTQSSGSLSKEGHQVAFSAAVIMFAVMMGK